jgi:ferredoxin-like protein FixX
MSPSPKLHSPVYLISFYPLHETQLKQYHLCHKVNQPFLCAADAYTWLLHVYPSRQRVPLNLAQCLECGYHLVNICQKKEIIKIKNCNLTTNNINRLYNTEASVPEIMNIVLYPLKFMSMLFGRQPNSIWKN